MKISKHRLGFLGNLNIYRRVFAFVAGRDLVNRSQDGPVGNELSGSRDVCQKERVEKDPKVILRPPFSTWGSFGLQDTFDFRSVVVCSMLDRTLAANAFFRISVAKVEELIREIINEKTGEGELQEQ